MAYFLPLLIALLLVELAVFAFAAAWIGVLPSLGLCFVSAGLGAAIALKKGRESLEHLRTLLQRREALTDATLDTACFLIAGFLFMFPGFFSDFLALFLLIPGVRKKMKLRVAVAAPFSRPARTGDDVIEADYVRIDETDRDEPEKPALKSLFL